MDCLLGYHGGRDFLDMSGCEGILGMAFGRVGSRWGLELKHLYFGSNFKAESQGTPGRCQS